MYLFTALVNELPVNSSIFTEFLIEIDFNVFLIRQSDY